MKSCSAALAIAASTSIASGVTVMFDIDSVAGREGVTLAGWTSVTGPDNGGTLTGTDGTRTLTVTGAASGRDRGTAATVQGADNGDNQVPQGTFGDMWRDIAFSTTGTMTLSLGGLDAMTIYPVTIYSYDSGQGATSTSSWNGAANSISFIGDIGGFPGPDPNTDTLDDYNVTFNITTDASGNATIAANRESAGGLLLFNGLVVGDAVPEPSTGIFAFVGALLMMRRRR